jgi:hypothetical protein
MSGQHRVGTRALQMVERPDGLCRVDIGKGWHHARTAVARERIVRDQRVAGTQRRAVLKVERATPRGVPGDVEDSRPARNVEG